MHRERHFVFLGTAAGDANFGQPDSAGLPPKDIRRYACNYLAPDILIDFNHHTAEALDTYEIDRDRIRHLLVSHGHYDHFQPVEILRFAEALPHPLAVYGNTMVRDALDFCRTNRFDPDSKRFVRHRCAFNVEMNVLTPGMSASVGATNVTALLGNHFMNKPYCIMEQQALNFVIQVHGKTIFYGLDSSYTMPETRERLTQFRFDVAIVDATFGPLDIDPVRSGHHNWRMLDETLAEFREAGCIDAHTVIVADHLSTQNVEPYDEIVGTLAEKGLTLAYDGFELKI